MTYTVEPIGVVRAQRATLQDDHWGGSQAVIELTEDFGPEALHGLADFSHVEVVFLFHQVAPEGVVRGARHPRGNPQWPQVGIFAQRAKNRPNRLGVSVCRVMRCEGRTLTVAELDAMDGTPVLDLKPVLAEFLPRGPVHQPAWAHDLMRAYWLPDHQPPTTDH